MSHDLQTSNDLLRLIDAHRFHNPLSPRSCQLCRNEEYRARNTPTVRWSRAVTSAFHPPMPVAVMLGAILVLTCALAVLLA